MYLPFHFLVCFYGNEYTAGCLFLLPWRFLIQYTFYSSGPSITLESSHCKLFQDFFLSGLIVLAVLKFLDTSPSILPFVRKIHLLREKGWHWILIYIWIQNAWLPWPYFVGVAETVTMLCKTEHALFMEMEFHLLYQIINLVFIIVDTDPL